MADDKTEIIPKSDEKPDKNDTKTEPSPVPKAPDKPKRFICEATTVFEINGSTVTYRENQIMTADSREYLYALEFNVPLRELNPIR